MYTRNLLPVIESLLKEFRALYLTGVRQCGKTTLVRLIAKRLNMRYISLDDQATLSAVESDPQGFIHSLGSHKVVLDEFQYVPDLIPAIKQVSDSLDSTEKGKFLLTGSADIFKSAKVQEALPGHMAKLELFPLSLSESHGQPLNIIDFILAKNFLSDSVPFLSREDLAGKILQGGYPEVQSKSPRAVQMWFKSYLEGRLFKDFESLHAARGDYYSKLRAMMPFLAGLSGNLLKYSNIANDLELNDKVVKSYIEILELMFMVHRVPSYVRNRAKRLVVRMPKVHLADTGLACHLLGVRSEGQLLKSQYFGGLLESLVYTECRKQASWARESIEMYHFRDKRKHEVDFVIERNNTAIIGVEVKASATVKVQDFRGMAKLAEYAGSSFETGIMFYTGQTLLPFKYGKHTFFALPVAMFLEKFQMERA